MYKGVYFYNYSEFIKHKNVCIIFRNIYIYKILHNIDLYILQMYTYMLNITINNIVNLLV